MQQQGGETSRSKYFKKKKVAGAKHNYLLHLGACAEGGGEFWSKRVTLFPQACWFSKYFS